MRARRPVSSRRRPARRTSADSRAPRLERRIDCPRRTRTGHIPAHLPGKAVPLAEHANSARRAHRTGWSNRPRRVQACCRMAGGASPSQQREAEEHERRDHHADSLAAPRPRHACRRARTTVNDGEEHRVSPRRTRAAEQNRNTATATPRAVFQRGAHDAQLADERAERRRWPVTAKNPATRMRADTGERHAIPEHGVRRARAGGAADVAGAQEQTPLGEAVVPHMKIAADNPVGPSPAPDGEDAHVLDAGVREHALEVALPQKKQRRDHHREQSQHQQRARASSRLRPQRPSTCLTRRMARKATVVAAAGQHRADDAGRLAVRVGLPGVHRRETHLGAVAHEQQHQRRDQTTDATAPRPARASPAKVRSPLPPPCSDA